AGERRRPRLRGLLPAAPRRPRRPREHGAGARVLPTAPALAAQPADAQAARHPVARTAAGRSRGTGRPRGRRRGARNLDIPQSGLTFGRMEKMRLIALEDTVVFPGMTVTLPIDVGDATRVLLVPKHDNQHAKVGTV